MKKTTLFLLLLCLFSLQAVSQQNKKERMVALSGKVSDSFTKMGVHDCKMSLLAADSTVLDTMTVVIFEGNAYYGFDVPPKRQRYIIRAEHKYYETAYMPYELKRVGRNTQLYLPLMLMKLKGRGQETTLGELKVTATKVKMVHRGDTIVFNADAFNVGEGNMLDGLIRQLKQSRGDLAIRPEDFWGWSTGARFYPLLYLLTRTNHARDWGTNLELSNNLLGKNSTLDVHHIFPKDLLYKAGKSKAIVNSLANYAFLIKETNIAISNRSPEEYIPEYRKKCPGAIDTHWIPDNPALLTIDQYEAFLEQRRILLAKAANQLLNSLYNGQITEVEIQSFAAKQFHDSCPEEEEIEAMSAWMTSHGLNEGVANFELLDDSGNTVAIIDLAWPQGVQHGLSAPLALLLNETADTQATVSKYGYRYYTSAEELRDYIQANYLQ